MWPRQFNSANNFLSPSPDWSYKPSNPDLPISKSSQLSEDELGSMEYELWKEIGNNFMIKNTVNNWLVCYPDGGSLVNMVNGGINCNISKVIVEGNCEDVTPTSIQMDGSSIGLKTQNGIYYYFYTKGSGTWAVSDPCGQSGLNQLDGVPNPAGWLYARNY